jgi:hypothetical protein
MIFLYGFQSHGSFFYFKGATKNVSKNRFLDPMVSRDRHGGTI